MAGSQYLVPAMPARAARTSYSGPSRLRIPRVVNLRHGYPNARRRRLQTIFSSQPVNPSRNHQPPTVAEAVARDRTFLPCPYPPPLHSTKRLTSGLGETRIPNWRHVQPSSWGEGDTVSESPGVRSPQPAPRGDTASRMVNPITSEEEARDRDERGENGKLETTNDYSLSPRCPFPLCK